MAQVKAINGSKLIIRIDDGTGSNFVARCSINAARGIEFTAAVNETEIPDCDALDEPGWMEREIGAKSGNITGEGMLHTTDLDFFWTWFDSGDARGVQVAVDTLAADGGGYWYGDAVLPSFNPAAAGRREKATFSCNIQSDGKWQWQDAA